MPTCRSPGLHRGGTATLALVLLALLAPPPASAQEQDPAPTDPTPAFEHLRYEEDYAYLRGRDVRGWTRLKHVPVGGGAYLSLGGEVRLRGDYFEHFEWEPQPAADAFLLQRYLLHADVHAGPAFRLFAQAGAHLEHGRFGGPGPVDENAVDLPQLFVDLRVPVGPAVGVVFRPGRQELSLGRERLVAVREGQNVRRSFEAVQALVEAPRARIRAFLARPVEVERGAFDDVGARGEALWGLYASLRPAHDGGRPLVPAEFDLYYLGFDREEGRFARGTAAERRHSFGLRLARPGPAGGLSYDAEALVQTGAFGGGRIRAWTAALAFGYALERLPTRPALGLRLNVASGDGDPADGDLGSFNPLYPNGGYFGGIGLAPMNHAVVHPSLALALAPGLALGVDWAFFWRHRTGDGVYAFPRVLLRPPAGSHARFVGHQPTVEVAFAAGPRLTLAGGYTRFVPGPFLKEAGPHEPAVFASVAATYRF